MGAPTPYFPEETVMSVMSVVPTVRVVASGTATVGVRCCWCGDLQVSVRVLPDVAFSSRPVHCRSCTVLQNLLAGEIDARSPGFPFQRVRVKADPRTRPPVDRRTCVSSKVFYPHQIAARAGLSAWRERRRPGQSRGQIYDCPWCPGWHLTSGKAKRYSTR